MKTTPSQPRRREFNWRRRFTIDCTEATHLLDNYKAEARRCIKQALYCRAKLVEGRPGDWADALADWLKWAKDFGSQARNWANKIGVTLGRADVRHRRAA